MALVSYLVSKYPGKKDVRDEISKDFLQLSPLFEDYKEDLSKAFSLNSLNDE
jgi:hypothetical protein